MWTFECTHVSLLSCVDVLWSSCKRKEVIDVALWTLKTRAQNPPAAPHLLMHFLSWCPKDVLSKSRDSWTSEALTIRLSSKPSFWRRASIAGTSDEDIPAVDSQPAIHVGDWISFGQKNIKWRPRQCKYIKVSDQENTERKICWEEEKYVRRRNLSTANWLPLVFKNRQSVEDEEESLDAFGKEYCLNV